MCREKYKCLTALLPFPSILGQYCSFPINLKSSSVTIWPCWTMIPQPHQCLEEELNILGSLHSWSLCISNPRCHPLFSFIHMHRQTHLHVFSCSYPFTAGLVPVLLLLFIILLTEHLNESVHLDLVVCRHAEKCHFICQSVKVFAAETSVTTLIKWNQTSTGSYYGSFSGRTMRRQSLRSMKSMLWMCWSAPEKGRSASFWLLLLVTLHGKILLCIFSTEV